MRVVLDTNVVVSAFISPAGVPARLFALWQQREFQVVVSEALLSEYRNTLLYERVAVRHQLGVEEVVDLIGRIRRFAVLAASKEVIAAIVEDPADNRVLECAVAGGVDYIITGDKRQLLRLQEFQGIQILSPAGFLSVLQE